MSTIDPNQYFFPLNSLKLDSDSLIALYHRLVTDPCSRSSERTLLCPANAISSFLQNPYSYFFEDWCFFLETDGASNNFFVIHKDGDANGCIFVPLLNCTRSSKTIFYEECYPVRAAYKNRVQHLLNPDSVEPVLEVSLTPDESAAYLLRCGKWHSVYNGSRTTERRVALSWRAKQEFSWAEISAAFKESVFKLQP